MRPFASRFVELWRCSVHQLDDAKLGMIDLFGASSSGCLLRNRGRLSDGMIVFQDHYPIFMIFVGRFALDITKIRKPVKCHGILLSLYLLLQLVFWTARHTAGAL